MKRFGFDAKLERAKQHIIDFERAQQIFLDQNPYVAVHYSEVNPRDYVIEFRLYESCPDHLLTIVGDAIHNLRSALDHLAHQLEIANERRPDKSTQFRVYENRLAFDNA